MTENEALAKMVSPQQRRSRVWLGGVLQVWITRACNLACTNCTQGSNLAGKPGMITPEQFEQACISLKDYFGVVGMFGGLPTLHPKFPQLCEIMRRHIPKKRCGLWANNLRGHGKLCRETFNPAVSNLNVHLDRAAYDEMRRDWPECKPVGLDTDSRHSPPWVAMRDVVADEGERWELISGCDINQNWSALIGVFRGELRGWFCEIAGAQAMLHQHNPDYPDTGLPVVPGWWDRPMAAFAEQVRFHCHQCGIPLRGHGELSQNPAGVEQTSVTHADVYRPKVKGRLLQIVTDRGQLGENVGKVNEYIQNASK